MAGERFYEGLLGGKRRSAPAATRNREPVADVLANWLAPTGLVLEVASGTGEHVIYFAKRFPALEWQPSDVHPDALSSIQAWRTSAHVSNVRKPIVLDAASANWAIDSSGADLGIKMQSADYGFDAVLNLNMVHISPWTAAVGLLNGASRVLKRGGALILYGPWLKSDITTASSNLEFDRQLRERDPEWGLRHVEDFEAEAAKRNFALEQVCQMPANNLMLLFRLEG